MFKLIHLPPGFAGVFRLMTRIGDHYFAFGQRTIPVMKAGFPPPFFESLQSGLFSCRPPFRLLPGGPFMSWHFEKNG